MHWILWVDHHAYRVVNQVWVNSLFDRFMPWVTDWRNTWWLLLIGVVYWIFVQRMRAVKTLLGCVLAVGLSDFCTYRVAKPLVKRPRPEFVLGRNNIRLLVPSSSSYSFPSNHASNSFAAANYIANAQPGLGIIVYPLAWLISYSRVYVGVHFPFDVIGGGLLGVLYAFLARLLVDGLTRLLATSQKKKCPDAAHPEK